jgi:competence protein ComEA
MSPRKIVLPLLGALFVVSVASQAHGYFDRKQSSPVPTEGVVNVNTATAEQLALLPGIGPSRAEAIIQARQNRPFRAVQDLLRVRGIGPATLQNLRPYVSVDGETTLTRPVRAPRSE